MDTNPRGYYQDMIASLNKIYTLNNADKIVLFEINEAHKIPKCFPNLSQDYCIASVVPPTNISAEAEEKNEKLGRNSMLQQDFHASLRKSISEELDKTDWMFAVDTSSKEYYESNHLFYQQNNRIR